MMAFRVDYGFRSCSNALERYYEGDDGDVKQGKKLFLVRNFARYRKMVLSRLYANGETDAELRLKDENAPTVGTMLAIIELLHVADMNVDLIVPGVVIVNTSDHEVTWVKFKGQDTTGRFFCET